MSSPAIQQVHLKKKSRVLALSFADGSQYQLAFELLRVFSPSAEVKGHGPGQEVLQWGKENVLIDAINTVGNYAIQLLFDDGHDSGIYSWSYLHELCLHQDEYWQSYLKRLQQAGKSRGKKPPSLSVVNSLEPPSNSD